jgi:hypothetical protein
VPKSNRKVPQNLTIHPLFEPGRIARVCLEEAYAYLVPKVQGSAPVISPINPTAPTPSEEPQERSAT